MSRKPRDITGLRSGKLVALSFYKKDKHGAHLWFCKCDCGNFAIVQKGRLTAKKRGIKSCGCAKGNYKHGCCKKENKYNPTYQTWQAMKSRCNRKTNKEYQNYGGRGISYCSRWEKFENFLEDMKERPEGKTLDRIDNDGDYEPSNCRWATPLEQGRNTRKNKWHTFNGETLTQAEFARKYGLSDYTLFTRLKNGWSLEKALTTPIMKVKTLLEYKGELLTIREIAKRAGIRHSILKGRLDLGWNLEAALTTPIKRSPPLKTIEYKGERCSISEVAKKVGMRCEVLRRRLRKGWDLKRAIETPFKENKLSKPIEYKGETLSICEVARKVGIDCEVLRSRLNLGWSVEKAATTPVRKLNKTKKD